MVWTMARVKARNAKAKVEGAVVKVAVVEEILEGVLETVVCPSPPRS